MAQIRFCQEKDIGDKNMEQEPELTVGDIVLLKSGGPHMTVTCVYKSDGTAKCEWFNEDDSHVRNHLFYIETLKQASYLEK